MNERPSNEFKVHVVTLDEAVRCSLHAILGVTLRLTKHLFLEDAHVHETRNLFYVYAEIKNTGRVRGFECLIHNHNHGSILAHIYPAAASKSGFRPGTMPRLN